MILVTDINIQSFKQIKPLFEKFLTNPSTKDKNLVIICPEIEPEPLASIVANKLAGAIKCVVIKAPGYGDQRTELLKDIAVLTGATFISDEAGASLEQCDTLHLGTADKIQSTETTTTIIDGAGDQIAIQDRAESIKQKMAQADNDFLKTKLQERVSKLIGGIAIIRVGANTEMEMKNKKFKIEDALNATRSAMEEGIVDGAGMALAWTAIPRMDMPADEYTILAQSILDQAKVYPSKQIITNA